VTRQEVTQYQVSGIGVVEGADLDFKQPLEAPCRDCGGMVDLTSIITVNTVAHDGTETTQEMTEADARALIAQVEIAPPPVLCDQHQWVENEVKLPRD